MSGAEAGASARDRRGGTPDLVRVRVLGGFQIDGVDLARLGSRKARLLLKRLTLARGRPVAPDSLADTLWPDRQPARPNDQLSVLVSRLRAVLGQDRLVRLDGGYAFLPDWLDLSALADLVAEVEHRLASGAIAAARVAADAAVELVRGPLLPDVDEDHDWLVAERVAVNRLIQQARLLAAQVALRGGDGWTASDQALHVIATEPYDEMAVRLVISAYAISGRQAQAISAYTTFANRLREEMGVDPAKETEEVYLAVLRGEPPPGLEAVPTGGATLGPAGMPVLPPTPTAATHPLVGRDHELALLDDELARVARTGQPRLTSVEGESGIGKTALLVEWAERARARGAAVLWARGEELAGAPPFQPIVDVLRERMRWLDPDEASAVLGRDVDLVTPLVRRGASAGFAPDASPVSPLAVEGVGKILFYDALAAVVGRLAGARPLVLVVDDAQWVDESTAGWLHHCTRGLAARAEGLYAAPARAGQEPRGTTWSRRNEEPSRLAPVDPAWGDVGEPTPRDPGRDEARRTTPGSRGGLLLVVLGRRPEEGPVFRPDRTIEVGPLDLAAATALVGAERATELYGRAGGHPLFLVELSRTDAAELPESIRAVVADRAERAERTGVATATWRAAAVLGPGVDLDLLAAVTQRPAGELLDDLEAGARWHLLVEQPTGFAFAHQLVREALVAATGPSRRALVHRAAARWLAARPRRQPLDVAYHARLGGDASLAARAYSEAAQVAFERLDHEEANRLLDLAIELEDDGLRRASRARSRVLASRFADALEDAKAAIAAGAVAAGLEAAATAAYYLRDFEGALRYATEGAEIATDPELRASCLALSGRVLHGVGQVEAAEERLVAATAAGGPTIRPVAGTWLASVRIHRGDPAAALRALPDALMVEHSHNPLVTPLSHLAAGYASAMLGRPAAALTEFDKHLAASVRLQSDRYAGRSDNMRGWVLRNVGALEAADELNRSAYEVSVRHDAVEPRMHALLDLADGRLRIGDLAGAAGYLRRYHDEFTDHLFAWRNEWRAALLEARLRLAAGELDQAEELGAQVVDLATPHRQARYETLARLVGFQCVRRRGRAVDLDAVGSCVEVLPSVAPLEAWWLTAEAARTFGVAAWMALAHDRVATLAAEAGPHAVTLRAAATRLLS